jgi:predicted dehydrogenase
MEAIDMTEPLRFGILGAARIAPAALVQPAANVEGAEVVGIAARDPERAASFAREHGVPRV